MIDLGRGTPEEFEAHAADIKGRIVLVRHELMFAAGTIHRRRKYDMARARGAVGFLIAGPLAGHVVAGSSGRQSGAGIAALGIAPETAARLARRAAGFPTVTMTIETAEGPAETETLLYDYPGKSDEWVVLSAHVDGHDLAESAMDNGTGLASVLAVTLSAAERDKIALNVNLDSVAGSSSLAALTSGYAGVEPFVLGVAEANGVSVRTVRPLMTNSDHANFAQAGIPALRLVAGFDDPAAHLRLVLTAADTRDKVGQGDLRSATLFTAALVAAACNAEPAEVGKWRK